MSKWVMRGPFQTSKFQELSNDIKNFSIHWVLTLQLLSEHSGVHRDSNSQCGSSLESVRVYSLTLSCTLGSMRHDSQASFLARNLATLCLGHKPDARVAIIIAKFQYLIFDAIKSIFSCLKCSNLPSNFVSKCFFYFIKCAPFIFKFGKDITFDY